MMISNVNALAGVYAGQQIVASHPASQVASAKSDEVVLSNQVQNFSQMLMELKNMNGVRQDKVDFYSEKIATGEYHVPAEDIARSLLNSRF